MGKARIRTRKSRAKQRKARKTRVRRQRLRAKRQRGGAETENNGPNGYEAVVVGRMPDNEKDGYGGVPVALNENDFEELAVEEAET